MTIKKYSLRSSGYHADPLPSKIDKCQMGSVGTRRKRNSQKNLPSETNPLRIRTLSNFFPTHLLPLLLQESCTNLSTMESKARQVALPSSVFLRSPQLPPLCHFCENRSQIWAQCSQARERGKARRRWSMLERKCPRRRTIHPNFDIQIQTQRRKYKYKHKDANTNKNTKTQIQRQIQMQIQTQRQGETYMVFGGGSVLVNEQKHIITCPAPATKDGCSLPKSKHICM